MSCELTTDEVAYIDGRMAELQAENERLRELVRDLWRWTHRPCSDCEHWRSVNGNVGECAADMCVLRRSIEDRMRELGVEVES